MADDGQDRQLDEVRDRGVLHALRESWSQLNLSLFGGGMRMPQLELLAGSAKLGSYQRETRVLAVSRALVSEQTWAVVLEVLKHEMVHQYVHEVLREDWETAHGPAFRAACARLGIDDRAAGMPSAAPLGPAEARILRRISQLLSLAQSDNQHEAEAAAATAQKLMLKYNVQLDARSEQPPAYGFRQVGRVTGRVQGWERRLSLLLDEFFFVDVIWVRAYRIQDGKWGSAMELCGSEANLQIAEYVHDFLVRSTERLWREHQRLHDISGNRDRLGFMEGVLKGFHEKLELQQRQQRKQGLVWVPGQALGRYFRQRHPHVRSVRRQGARPSDAFAHGQRAGRDLVLHRGVQGESQKGGRRGRPTPLLMS